MKINLANQVTLSRLLLAGVFFAVMSAFNAHHPENLLLYTALAVYILAGITDIIDGQLARRHSGVTMFGRVIDPFVDKVLTVGTFVFFASSHFAVEGGNVTGVRAWMVIIILVRELLVTDLRTVSEARGATFSATIYGKVKLLVQSVAAGWILLSLAIGGMTVAGGLYNSRLVVALVAVGVTVLSLAGYVRRADTILSER